MMTTEPDASFLSSLAAVDDGAYQALRTRLAEEAARDGILDVAYRTIDTPVGELLLAATERGLVRVAYPVQDHDAVLSSLASQVSPRVLHAPARLDEAARAVGTACARNPLPVVIPCHRVVRGDGSIGQYAGDERKLASGSVVIMV